MFLKIISTIGLISIVAGSLISTQVSTLVGEKYIAQSPITVQWTNLQYKATDIGIGAEGDAFAIGTDGNLYSYDLTQNSYQVIKGDREIPLLKRVDVDADGTPYVVTELGGQVYYLDEGNNWVLLPGCARDIGIGRGGEVWKVGCDEKLGGFGIWKLICPCDSICDCNTRQTARFRIKKHAKPHDERTSCFWHRIEGGGLYIDVDPSGQPWIVADNHKVFQFDGNIWKFIPGFDAQDISVSNQGVVFASGYQSDNLGRLVCGELGTWQLIKSPSKSVSVGPYSLPFIVDSNNTIRTTAKRGFN